jgi:hypothetical protein
MPEKELMKRGRVQGSYLSIGFVVRDMLGSGRLMRINTPSGAVLKLKG